MVNIFAVINIKPVSEMVSDKFCSTVINLLIQAVRSQDTHYNDNKMIEREF